MEGHEWGAVGLVMTQPIWVKGRAMGPGRVGAGLGLLDANLRV